MRLLKRSGAEPPTDSDTQGRDVIGSLRGTETREAAQDLGDTPLFREEAVREHAQYRDEGDVVRISPTWAAAVYWFLSAVFVVALLLAVFGKVHEYAAGPAVVLVSGHTELTAATPGVVEGVEVRTGERVQRGQVLVRLHSSEERSLVNKLQLEFDHELVALLRDPDDPVAHTAVRRIRADLELARARLEQRQLTAPLDGTVYDMRVRLGQLVNLGEPMVSLVQVDRQHELVVLIPGRYGPLLRTGQALRFRVTGYSHPEVDLTIRSLGDGVIGPSEVRRYLGPEIGDAVLVAQPVILVRAAIPRPTFESDGKAHPYWSGLQGTAEVRVGDERILFKVLPWTKALWEKLNG